MSRPTIEDLAKAANVGVSTVDRVLNGRATVRSQTAERVIAAAEKIGFHGVTVMKKRLSDQKTKIKFGFLLKQSYRKLYQMWADNLKLAVSNYPHAHGRSIVKFIDSSEPEDTVEALMILSREVDVIAMVAIDHPLINQAVDQLSFENIPVFTFVSDIGANNRAGYVGHDCVKKGKTAAWFMEHLVAPRGQVAVMIGDHRHLSQEICEMGFRSYFREKRSDLQVMNTLITYEEPEIAYQIMQKLLETNQGSLGIYVAGGGITGVMEALRQNNNNLASKDGQKITIIAQELTHETRAGLVSGIVDVVLSHSLQNLTTTIVDVMAQSVQSKDRVNNLQVIMPFDIYTKTNI